MKVVKQLRKRFNFYSANNNGSTTVSFITEDESFARQKFIAYLQGEHNCEDSLVQQSWVMTTDIIVDYE